MNVKVEKSEIPYAIKRGLDELWLIEQDIGALRDIQTTVGYGMFGDEKQIARLRFVASQVALECIQRACRSTREDVRERYTTRLALKSNEDDWAIAR